jgi:hypothetical protein
VKRYVLRNLGAVLFGLMVETALWPIGAAVVLIISYEAVKWIKHF